MTVTDGAQGAAIAAAATAASQSKTQWQGVHTCVDARGLAFAVRSIKLFAVKSVQGRIAYPLMRYTQLPDAP